jgi:hypothetical protein
MNFNSNRNQKKKLQTMTSSLVAALAALASVAMATTSSNEESRSPPTRMEWRPFRVESQTQCETEDCARKALFRYATWHSNTIQHIKSGALGCDDVRVLLFSPTDGCVLLLFFVAF